jgi:hypothetical protein
MKQAALAPDEGPQRSQGDEAALGKRGIDAEVGGGGGSSPGIVPRCARGCGWHRAIAQPARPPVRREAHAQAQAFGVEGPLRVAPRHCCASAACTAPVSSKGASTSSSRQSIERTCAMRSAGIRPRRRHRRGPAPGTEVHPPYQRVTTTTTRSKPWPSIAAQDGAPGGAGRVRRRRWSDSPVRCGRPAVVGGGLCGRCGRGRRGHRRPRPPGAACARNRLCLTSIACERAPRACRSFFERAQIVGQRMVGVSARGMPRGFRVRRRGGRSPSVRGCVAARHRATSGLSAVAGGTTSSSGSAYSVSAAGLRRDARRRRCSFTTQLGAVRRALLPCWPRPSRRPAGRGGRGGPPWAQVRVPPRWLRCRPLGGGRGGRHRPRLAAASCGRPGAPPRRRKCAIVEGLRLLFDVPPAWHSRMAARRAGWRGLFCRRGRRRHVERPGRNGAH